MSVSAPKPNPSSSPLGVDSSNTSAVATRARNCSRSAGWRRSSMIERLPRLYCQKNRERSGIFPVFVEGTDAACGAAAGRLHFDDLGAQTRQRQPAVLRLLVGQFDNAQAAERPRAGRAVAVDRTLLLCFHGDPPICARHITCSAVV